MLDRVFNQLRMPSTFGPNVDFHLFKDGIEPKWEDAACANGGAWVIMLPKNTSARPVLDEYWLKTVCHALACV